MGIFGFVGSESPTNALESPYISAESPTVSAMRYGFDPAKVNYETAEILTRLHFACAHRPGLTPVEVLTGVSKLYFERGHTGKLDRVAHDALYLRNPVAFNLAFAALVSAGEIVVVQVRGGICTCHIGSIGALLKLDQIQICQGQGEAR